MELKKKSYTTAVIVARFQCAELHEAHKELIDTVLKEHPKVMIFLGLAPIRGSIRDPLDFAPRKQMIFEAYPHEKYPNLSVHYIKDNRSDAVWSVKLDENIRDLLSPSDTVVLYGSRDSFLVRYSGKYDVRELQATRYVSGTELRAKIAQAPQSNPQFRAGAIWATAQRYPLVYSTVDICVFDPKERRILLARKPLEDGYRFVGGFADPKKDDSFEETALRELAEETGLTVGMSGLGSMSGLRYVGSKKVDDWRYASNPAEKIMTHLYVGIYSMGAPQPSDDIEEVRWFKLDETSTWNIVPEHVALFNMARAYIDANFPVKE